MIAAWTPYADCIDSRCDWCSMSSDQKAVCKSTGPAHCILCNRYNSPHAHRGDINRCQPWREVQALFARTDDNRRYARLNVGRGMPSFAERENATFAERKATIHLIWNMEIPFMSNRTNGARPVGDRFPRTAVLSCLSAVMIATTFTGCAGFHSCCDYVGSCKSYVRNGFKVGPEYCKPAAPVADSWIDEYDERVRTELPNYADWWSVFNDPVLDRFDGRDLSAELGPEIGRSSRAASAIHPRHRCRWNLSAVARGISAASLGARTARTSAGGLLPLNTNTFCDRL